MTFIYGIYDVAGRSRDRICRTAGEPAAGGVRGEGHGRFDFFLPSLLLSRLELSDTQVYEPEIRALPGTASHFCEVVVLNLRTAGEPAAGGVRGEGHGRCLFCLSSLLLSSLELSDTQIYEP